MTSGKFMVFLVMTVGIMQLYATSFEVSTSLNGRDTVDIQIARNSPPAVEYAAFELQKYIKMISGVFLPLHNRSFVAPKGIILALPDSELLLSVKKQLSQDLEALKGNDGYAVRVINSNLYILADCPRGILNGVYRFLMRNTDIIWPRPANELVIYSPQPKLIFKEVDYLDIPGFARRGMGWNYSRAQQSQELMLWQSRVCSNNGGTPIVPANDTMLKRLGFIDGYINIFGLGHNLISYWLPVARYGKTNPEFYMRLDSQHYVKNTANPCVTNPEVVKTYIERLKEEYPNYQSAQVVVMQISDQSLCCECENCVKPLILADGTTISQNDPAFRSTQFFIFFNHIAQEFKKIAPDKMLQQYGYFFLAIPPKVKVESNIIISFCPYIRNDKESLFGASNLKWKQRTDEWLANTPNILWREYYYSGAAFPRPLADVMVNDLRYIHEKGVRRITSEITWSDDDFKPRSGMTSSDFWDTTAMEVWVFHQLFWAPYLNPQKLREDYLNRTYREAAPSMIEYYKLIHHAWLNDKSPSAFNDDVYKSAAYYILEKGLTDKCRTHLTMAEKNAVHPDSLRLIKAQRTIFEKWITASKTNRNELEVPFIKTTSYPGADLEQGVWEKAALFPQLKLMQNSKENAKVKCTAKLFCTARELYLGIRIQGDPAILRSNPNDTERDKFPTGDHVELFFVNNKDKYYYQLAYDVNNNMYDGKLTDPSWDGDWEVKTARLDDGWSSVVKIPFTTMGFEPLVSNKLRFLLFLTSYNQDGSREHAIWGNGKVHSPDSFGELKISLAY